MASPTLKRVKRRGRHAFYGVEQPTALIRDRQCGEPRITQRGYAKVLTTDLKLARFPTRSPLPVAALPSMSLVPSAPFTNSTDILECGAAAPPFFFGPLNTPNHAKNFGTEIIRLFVSFVCFVGSKKSSQKNKISRYRRPDKADPFQM